MTRISTIAAAAILALTSAFAVTAAPASAANYGGWNGKPQAKIVILVPVKHTKFIKFSNLKHRHHMKKKFFAKHNRKPQFVVGFGQRAYNFAPKPKFYGVGYGR